MAGIRRVLVTGAHGFIGSHLTRALLEQGYEVGILSRQTSDLSGSGTLWGVSLPIPVIPGIPHLS